MTEKWFFMSFCIQADFLESTKKTFFDKIRGEGEREVFRFFIISINNFEKQ